MRACVRARGVVCHTQLALIPKCKKAGILCQYGRGGRTRASEIVRPGAVAGGRSKNIFGGAIIFFLLSAMKWCISITVLIIFALFLISASSHNVQKDRLRLCFLKIHPRVRFESQNRGTLCTYDRFRMNLNAEKTITVRTKHVEKSPFLAQPLTPTKSAELGSTSCTTSSSDAKLAIGVHIAGIVESVGASVLNSTRSL